MSTPTFVLARNANELAKLLDCREPYVARGGTHLIDHEAMAEVVEAALTLVRDVNLVLRDPLQLQLDLEDGRQG